MHWSPDILLSAFGFGVCFTAVITLGLAQEDFVHPAMGSKGIIDRVAAVLILQSFLDARSNERSRQAAESR
jgi:hypothetical protein